MAAKSLDELIREFEAERRPACPVTKPKKGLLAGAIAHILFFLAIASALVLTSMYSPSRTGPPKMFMGYSCFAVTGSGMPGEIPEGSLIVVRQRDPGELGAGDIVTYMHGPNTPVTQKIEAVIENYRESGSPGFRMRGVCNTECDVETVRHENVLGQVVFTVPVLGAVMVFLEEHIYVEYIVYALCAILFLVLFIMGYRKQNVEGG